LARGLLNKFMSNILKFRSKECYFLIIILIVVVILTFSFLSIKEKEKTNFNNSEEIIEKTKEEKQLESLKKIREAEDRKPLSSESIKKQFEEIKKIRD
jgi:uncharacterized membrane protein